MRLVIVLLLGLLTLVGCEQREEPDAPNPGANRSTDGSQPMGR